jgi:hypothetical protein
MRTDTTVTIRSSVTCGRCPKKDAFEASNTLGSDAMKGLENQIKERGWMLVAVGEIHGRRKWSAYLCAECVVHVEKMMSKDHVLFGGTRPL